MAERQNETSDRVEVRERDLDQHLKASGWPSIYSAMFPETHLRRRGAYGTIVVPSRGGYYLEWARTTAAEDRDARMCERRDLRNKGVHNA